MNAFPVAVGLILAGLFVSLNTLGLLWRERTQRAGYWLATSLWLTAWGAIVNLGQLPVVPVLLFVLSLAAIFLWLAGRFADH